MYIFHPAELSLKWKNKIFFENKLIDNLKLKWWNNIDIKKLFGRFLVYWKNEKLIENILSTTFGIANWSKVYEYDLLDIEELSKNIIYLIEEIDLKWYSFKVEVKRSNKSYKWNSMEISRYVWSRILERFKLKVDLHNPDFKVFIEIVNKNIYIYFEKKQWLWWLPIWSSWKIISLISWWIDSPVASWLMMKRGVEVVLLHGYNERLDIYWRTKEKIISLSKMLAKYQGKLKLYLFPVANITRWILDNVRDDYRMIFFKIFLMKIADLVADMENAWWITTWDNLAQVASQTLENLNLIYSFSDRIILSPLLWYDKLEIISLAKKIGTYDISANVKCEDVCSKISSKHPQTKWKVDYVKDILSSCDININNFLEKAEILEFHF